MIDDFEPAPWPELSEPARALLASTLSAAGYPSELEWIDGSDAEVLLFELLSPRSLSADAVSEEAAVDALRALAARFPAFSTLRAWDDRALDANRSNPIAAALERGWPAAAAELVLLGVDPFDPADAPLSPLAEACARDGSAAPAAREFFAFLAGFDKEALLSWRDPSGDGLLHVAAAADCDWMLSGLLALGADPLEPASFHASPMDRARAAHANRCQDLLRVALADSEPERPGDDLLAALSSAASAGRILLDGCPVDSLVQLRERLIPDA